MTRKQSGPSPKGVWAYGYEIIPPQSEERLSSIRELLDSEHAEAKRGARTWRGKVVLKEQVTHILVVSDSAAQDRAINRKLEAALKLLNVGFQITAPMAVDDDATQGSADVRLTKSSMEGKPA